MGLGRKWIPLFFESEMKRKAESRGSLPDSGFPSSGGRRAERGVSSRAELIPHV